MCVVGRSACINQRGVGLHFEAFQWPTRLSEWTAVLDVPQWHPSDPEHILATDCHVDSGAGIAGLLCFLLVRPKVQPGLRKRYRLA